jgi:hypothetical protein
VGAALCSRVPALILFLYPGHRPRFKKSRRLHAAVEKTATRSIMSGASPADKGRKRPKKESRQERRRIKGSGKGKKDEKNEEEEGQPKGGHGRSANLYHDLDVGSSLDDLTKYGPTFAIAAVISSWTIGPGGG